MREQTTLPVDLQAIWALLVARTAIRVSRATAYRVFRVVSFAVRVIEIAGFFRVRQSTALSRICAVCSFMSLQHIAEKH